MTKLKAGLLGFAVIAMPTGTASAQVRPLLSATTRLLEPNLGTADPALWLGFGVRVDRPSWELAASSSGALGGHGAWGGAGSLDARYHRSLGRGTTFFARMTGAFDRPLGFESVGEGGAQLAVGRLLGRATVQLGVAGLERFRQGRASFAPGAFISTMVDLGELTLSGELGRFVAVAGSADAVLADQPAGQAASDTLLRAGAGGNGAGSARGLSHGAFGARWRKAWFEVTGRVMSRSRLALGDGVGWEAGMAVVPFSGTKLRVQAGRSPASSSYYLPYRRQFSVGVELTRRRGKLDASASSESELQPMFEAITGQLGLTSILVRAIGATHVEIAGDFTEWQPVALSPAAPGLWHAAFSLPHGVHQINVRFDGGPWEVPSGLGAAEDGFGGRVGVLVVR